MCRGEIELQGVWYLGMTALGVEERLTIRDNTIDEVDMLSLHSDWCFVTYLFSLLVRVKQEVTLAALNRFLRRRRRFSAYV